MSKLLKLGKYTVYQPSILEMIPDKDLRDEYNRLRNIYKKRSTAYERSEWADSEKYRQISGRYQEPAGKLSNEDLIMNLSEMASVLTFEMPGVKALQQQRSATLKTLMEHGYTGINKSNYEEFTRFMEAIREFSMGRATDSPRDAALFGIAERKGVDPDELLDDLDYWREHMFDLKYAKVHNGDGSVRTLEDYRQAINRKRG